MLLLTLVLAAGPMNTKLIEDELVKKFGEAQRARVERGVRQVAALWRKEDGDLKAFAADNFLVEQKDLDDTFARFETNFEQLDGHLLEIGRELQKPTMLDVGPLLKVDPYFAEYDPSAHLAEDLFNNKLGFVVLLNYPLLAANVFHADSGTLAYAPTLLLEVAGLRVGIVGLACPIVDKTMPAHFSTGLRFTNGLAELPGHVQHLRQQERADVVVLLSHCGFPQDVALLTAHSELHGCQSD